MVNKPMRFYRIKLIVDLTVNAENAEEAAKVASWIELPDALTIDDVKVDSIEDVTDKVDET